MCDKCECTEERYFTAAGEWYSSIDALVDAKMKEAEAFLRFKARKDTTDGMAARMAYVETNGATDIAQAKVDYLRSRLGR